MPKRPQQHQTDDEAKAIFQAAIAPLGTQNSHPSDYGNDYSVELFGKDKQSTGDQAIVQLKGSRSPKYRKGFISQVLSLDHARYYLKKEQLPVFLVVVDVVKKVGYWCFLQEFLLADNVRKRLLKKKGDITIRVPLANRIQDGEQLRQGIGSATSFMVSHKIRLEQWRLEAMDPRFEAKVTATENATHTEFRAVDKDVEISYQFTFPTDVAAEKMRQFLLGEEIQVSPENIKITGSPLFEVEKGGSVALRSSQAASATLIATDTDGNEMAILEGLPGEFSGGIKGGTFKGGMSGGPLGLEILYDLTAEDRIEIRFSMTFDGRVWEGIPVLNLPYFSSLLNFTRALSSCAMLKVDCYREGLDCLPVQFQGEHLEQLRQHLPNLTFTEKMQTVARKTGRNPRLLPADQVNDDDIADINVLHALLTKGIYESDGQTMTFNFKWSTEEIRKSIHSDEFKCKGSTIEYTGEHPRKFLGETINLGLLKVSISSAEIPEGREEFEARVASATTEYCKVTFVGEKGSTFRIELLQQPDVTPKPK